MTRQSPTRAFSRTDLIVMLIVGTFLIVLLVLLIPQLVMARIMSRQLRDSVQVRGIHTAMVTWSHNHADQYPLPSALDVANTTVADLGAAKDQTANILSCLVFNGSITTNLLINPAEVNPKIRAKVDYAYQKPKTAADPANAMWDPSFSADFTTAKGGNNSYSHLLPSGGRSTSWSDTFLASQPVIGGRGPRVVSVQQIADAKVSPVFEIPNSLTLLIHGSHSRWEGNICFADSHVEFLVEPKTGTYKNASGQAREDVLFFDEPDDAAGTNAFLGIFTKAGPTPAAFKSIWD